MYFYAYDYISPYLFTYIYVHIDIHCFPYVFSIYTYIQIIKKVCTYPHTHTLRAQICAGSAVPWEHLASDFATLQAPSPATNGKANYVGQTRNQATAMFRPDPEEVVSFPPTTGPGEPLPASGHHANSQLSSSFPRSSISRLSSSLAG